MNLQEFKSSNFGLRIRDILIRQNNPKTENDFKLLEMGMNNTHRQLTFNGYFKRNNSQELEEYIQAINY
tara:strand:- start:271 stop:477 length:207 start_codon:yes stop_codon:yes gene_type:complete